MLLLIILVVSICTEQSRVCNSIFALFDLYCRKNITWKLARHSPRNFHTAPSCWQCYMISSSVLKSRLVEIKMNLLCIFQFNVFLLCFFTDKITESRENATMQCLPSIKDVSILSTRFLLFCNFISLCTFLRLYSLFIFSLYWYAKTKSRKKGRNTQKKSMIRIRNFSLLFWSNVQERLKMFCFLNEQFI